MDILHQPSLVPEQSNFYNSNKSSISSLMADIKITDRSLELLIPNHDGSVIKTALIFISRMDRSYSGGWKGVGVVFYDWWIATLHGSILIFISLFQRLELDRDLFKRFLLLLPEWHSQKVSVFDSCFDSFRIIRKIYISLYIISKKLKISEENRINTRKWKNGDEEIR